MNQVNTLTAEPPLLSIVIPMLNEAGVIAKTLSNLVDALRQDVLSLDALRDHDIGLGGCEIIVVDGGSGDASVQRVMKFFEQVDDRGLHCQLLEAAPGRAGQMNEGAAVATGKLLVFLHADTIVSAGFGAELVRVLDSEQYRWGRFDVSLSGSHPMLRCVEWFMNNRSRLTSVATGDQVIFVKRSAFKILGGFAPIPLMEDVEISKRLKKLSPPYCSSLKVITSSRRWEVGGIYKTIFLMWRLRYKYYRGADPHQLIKKY